MFKEYNLNKEKVHDTLFLIIKIRVKKENKLILQ